MKESKMRFYLWVGRSSFEATEGWTGFYLRVPAFVGRRWSRCWRLG